MEPDCPFEIDISDTQNHLRLDPEQVRNLTGQALRILKVERATLSIALVDNAAIQAINAQYLGHDWATDVISFPDSDNAPDSSALNGELILSTEMAVNTAEQMGVEPFDEFLLYLVHGVLHLRGYEDQTQEEVAVMRRRESEVLAALKIPPLSNKPKATASGASPSASASRREKPRWSV